MNSRVTLSSQVAELGTHEELQSRPASLYSDMWAAQQLNNAGDSENDSA